MDRSTQDAAFNSAENSSRDVAQATFRFLRTLLYHKAYLSAVLFVAGLLGTFYILTASRVYEATASLLILQTGADVWDTNMSMDGVRSSVIPTYEKLFSSAVVVEGALRQLREMPDELLVDFRSTPPEEWGAALQKKLTARSLRLTNIIEIRYRSQSPAAGESVVRAVVKSYLDFMEKNHKDVSAEIVTILDEERLQVEKQLTDKQRDLLDLQHRVADLGLTGHAHAVHPALQRVLSINEALIAARKLRVNLQAEFMAIRDAMQKGGDLRHYLINAEPSAGKEMILSALGLTPQTTEISSQLERKVLEDRARLDTLLAHYGPNHPRIAELHRTIENSKAYLAAYQSNVDQRIAGVRREQLGPLLAAMLEERLSQVVHSERELEQQYLKAEKEAVQLNDRRAELTLAELDVQRLRKLYDSLLERMSNIDIKQNGSDVRVAVVGEPVASERPISPKLSIVAIMTVVGGLLAGVGLVYVMDLLDDRFRSPEELREQLGVPVLAVVRKLTGHETGVNGGLQMHIAADSVESEAFRTLRTTLVFSDLETSRLAITSAEPGDGKTTVLSNLGASFAHTGCRTLLIDADMRRPGLTKLFEMRQRGGLSEILRSSDDIAEMCRQRIQRTDVENLHVIPCGPRPTNPAELLSTDRLGELIAWAETNYDKVLIDCPPVLAASDAAIIGRQTDGIMMVVQPAKNHRRVVIRAVEGLSSLGIKLLGVVANKVEGKDDSYYGYGSGYGYGYGYGGGYGSDEVEEHDPEVAADEETPPLKPATTEASTGTARRGVSPRRAA